jgi:hypothetical protein
MFKRRMILAAASFVVLSALSVVCQSADIAKTRFVSTNGRFTIDLPAEANDEVLPVGSATDGAATYTWTLPEGKISISFVEGIRGFSDGYVVVNDLADSVTASQLKAGGKVIERIEFSDKGHPGLELRLGRRSGSAVNRFILVRNRLYILTVNPTAEDNMSRMIEILDSFRALERGDFTA